MKDKLLLKLKTKIKESLIIGLLIRFAYFLYRMINSSLLAGVATAYERYPGKYRESMAHALICKIKPRENSILKWKMKISKNIETGALYRLYRSVARVLLGSSLRLYGFFFFAGGTVTLAIYLFKAYWLSGGFSGTVYLYTGIGMTALSLVMILEKRGVGHLIYQSKLLHFFFVKLLTFQKENMVSDYQNTSSAMPFLFGLLFGMSTWFVSPVYLFALIFGAMAVAGVFAKPESALILAVGLLPFLPTMALSGFILLIFAAYLFKLIRGKRTLKFDTLDVSVLIFLLFIVLGGLFSVNRTESAKSAAVFFVLGLSYFIIVNLVRSRQLVQKIMRVLVFDLAVCSLIGLYQNFFAASQSKWHDSELFSEIGTRVISTFENPNVFGEYLIMTIPLLVALLLVKNKVKYKMALFAGLALSLGALVFTWSRGAWLGFLFAVLVFFLIYSRKSLVLYCAGLLAVPFASFFLPESIMTRISSIGNMKDTSTSYRVYIWEGVVNMIRNFFASGIGIGTGAFTSVYPEYTLAGIETAPHSHHLFLQILVEMGVFGLLVFLAVLLIYLQKQFTFVLKSRNKWDILCSSAVFCGILAVLIQGFTDYVWYNYRVYGLFWIMIAYGSAIINTGKSENIEILES